jgi:hypothetical protein
MEELSLRDKLKMKMKMSKMGRLPKVNKEQKIEEIQTQLSKIIPKK